MISGAGDVIEPDDGVIAIGSGGNYALAAARVLVKHTQLDARVIAEEAMRVAAGICVYTNDQLTFEELVIARGAKASILAGLSASSSCAESAYWNAWSNGRDVLQDHYSQYSITPAPISPEKIAFPGEIVRSDYSYESTWLELRHRTRDRLPRR